MPEQRTREVAVTPFYRVAEVRGFSEAKGRDGETVRTLELSFSSEYDGVTRYDYFNDDEYIEILDHSPTSVRLDRINNGAPFLMDHDSRAQVGVIESARIDGLQGKAVIRLSKNAEDYPGYGNLVSDFRDGIRPKISFGYRVFKAVVAKRIEDGPDEIRITDWEPFEISSVSIPADPTVGIDRTFEPESLRHKPNTLTIRETVMPDPIAPTPDQANDNISRGLSDAVNSMNTLSTTVSAGMDTMQRSIAGLTAAPATDNGGDDEAAIQARAANRSEDTPEIAVKRERERVKSISELTAHVRKMPGINAVTLAELERKSIDDG